MPCYDPRDEEDRIEASKRANNALKEVGELKAQIKKLKRQEIEREVEVCKIMSAMLSFLNIGEYSSPDEFEEIFFNYEEIEQTFNVEKGLFKYHQEHRMEDQKFYIKTLKKMKKAETDKSIRKEIKEEIKKAKVIDLNTDFRPLVDRSYFSSKFLPAHK
jgi:hypothetical protein